MTLDNPKINPPQPLEKEAVLFVCVTCGCQDKPSRAGESAPLTSGEILYRTVVNDKNLPCAGRIQRVRCLGGCNHPCAVAVTSPGKITYLYGGLPVGDQIDETVTQIKTYLTQYALSSDGYVPPMDKPPLFRPVLVRIPDPGFISDTGVVTSARHSGSSVAVQTVNVDEDDAPPFASPLRQASDDA